MGAESLLVWLLVGLVAGWLASAVMGGGFGLLGDMIVGIVGAFLGGWIFDALDVGAPGGLGGSILVSFVGACALLLLLRAVRGAGLRRGAV